MKLFPKTLILACATFASVLPLIAENLYDVVDDAEKAINQKYPVESSIAHRLAKKELEDIVFSDKTEEEKIAAIRAKYPSTSSLRRPTESIQSSDLASLVFLPPLQWTINSIEIAYDIDSETNLLFSAESLYQEGNSNSREDSTGSSNATNFNAGAKTQLDVDVGGDINIKGLNPLKWFSAKAGYQWVTSGNAGINYTKTKSSQWNERAQRALSNNYEEKAKILHDTRITKCHLTFYILFKNNTDKDLLLDPQEFSVPVYAGVNRPLADAVPDTRLRSFRIPRNAYADLKFRAELNTTSALNLINYMLTNEPMIQLDRAQSTIASSDGSIQDAVQDSILETVPFRCRDMVLQIRKYNKDNPVTVADAMHALNAVFTKEPFVFDKDGNCVALMDVPLEKKGEVKVSEEKLPVLEINGSLFSAQVPSGTLNRPLSDGGLMMDIVNIVSDDDFKDVWENSSSSLQAHYVSYLRPVAEKGDGQAQNILAMCYYLGRGVTRNYSEALKWFRRSAENGILDSIAMLGVCYEDGKGVTQNYAEAARWYRKAAEQGDAMAQDYLGEFYYKGTGVPQNYDEAIKWYRKAAKQGDASAQNKIGLCYQSGYGVRKNENEAAQWFRKAAEQGFTPAECNLGYLYYMSKNYSDAVPWLRKAAEKGEVWPQKILGDLFYNGIGVSQNYAEAVKWYLKAADQGDAAAQQMLGLCYYSGLEGIQDYDEAVKWFRKAADQGNAWAQFWLGVCLREGYGITRNLNEAVWWFRKSAEQGNETAKEALKKLGY